MGDVGAGRQLDRRGAYRVGEQVQVLACARGDDDPVGYQLAVPSGVAEHDIYDVVKPLSSFTRGRTVLLGDAAHAMTPNLGQGAGQALEDAATLALLLRGASADELGAVLARYSEIRRKRTGPIVRR